MPDSVEAERAGQIAKVPLLLLSLNVISAVTYVVAASHGWRIPEEHGEVPVTGEPFVWFAGIFPIVALFSLLNLVWGFIILTRRQWHAARWWLFAALIWLGAVWIDFAHH